MFQRLGGGQQFELAIEELCGLEPARRSHHHAARDLGRLDVNQIQRRPLARRGEVRGLSVNLHATHAQPPPRRIEFHFLIMGH